MRAYRNITLAVPETVLRQIEHLAERKQISVSQLLTQTLEDIVAQQATEYAQARARHLAWLEHAAALGTRGQATWSRDSLYDR